MPSSRFAYLAANFSSEGAGGRFCVFGTPTVDVALLPYDAEVIAYVKTFRQKGGRTALVQPRQSFDTLSHCWASASFHLIFCVETDEKRPPAALHKLEIVHYSRACAPCIRPFSPRSTRKIRWNEALGSF